MRKTICSSLIISLLALGFVVSAQAQNGELDRHSAEFRNFDFTESATSATVPGISIYTKTVTLDIGENILYVTMSTTGDQHQGKASWFSCKVDGVFCNGGAGGAAGAPAGWIALGKTPAASSGDTNCNDGGGGAGDCHDNSINYQWCFVIPAASVLTGGPHTVNLRMAASSSGGTVFIEAAHFYIDATAGGSPTCTAGTP